MDGQNNLPAQLALRSALQPLRFARKTVAAAALLFALLSVNVATPATFAEAMGHASVDTADSTTQQLAPDSTSSPLFLAAKPDPAPSAAPDNSSTFQNPTKSTFVNDATPSAVAPSPSPSPAAAVDPSVTADPLKSSAPRNDIESAPIRVLQSMATPPSAAPTTPVPYSLPSGLTSALQVAAALTIVIGLIFVGKAVAKKYVPGAAASNGKGVIEILARYPLAKNQMLVLVRIGSQIVTLNQGKDSSQSVLVVSDPAEVAKIMGQIEGQTDGRTEGRNAPSIQAGFTKLLANARMDLEEPVRRNDTSDFELRAMDPENLDNQLDEMAAAKRQLMELRKQVRSVRDSLPRA